MLVSNELVGGQVEMAFNWENLDCRQTSFVKISGGWQPQAQHPLSRVQAWGWLVLSFLTG